MMIMIMEMTMMRTNSAFDLNTNEIMHQIIYLVKYKHNFNLAANFFLENDLPIELLNKKAVELSKLDIVKLTDSIMRSKNLKK